MSKLFESSTINSMDLPNRFVRSATWEGMAAEDGSVTQKLIDAMVDLAGGGVGLIISGHSYVRPEGQGSPRQLGIYKNGLIHGLREMTSAVHSCGGRIVMQLSHAGYFASGQSTGQPLFVVSDFDGLPTGLPRKEITERDIIKIVRSFADTAWRAKSAGFDGVQIHSAHGYLLSQFLSPAFNKRRDEYGGNVHNRARIHLEIYHAVREVVGRDYPVLIKMNCRDFVENGMDLDESLQVARLLANAGFDAIELSGGTFTSGRLSPCRSKIDSPDREAYFREEASVFKKKIDTPLILVGGIRSIEVAGQLVEDGVAEYISMSRPLIREPDLINRWKSGDRRKAECDSDNLCFGPGIKGDGIYCVTKKNEEAI
ncbi:MAG: NADH:flavin oxidoreductase [Syntrophobacterales bacterium]|nr:NADH:flavin oxidoreductase [Syntrophobacterales bacterium]